MNSKNIHSLIVIPCYNEGERLRPFLMDLCLITKNFPTIHILVVDDGSKTLHVRLEREVVEEAKKIKKNLQFLELPKNKGKGGALEAGFSVATTEIVGFADADGSTSAFECLRLISKLTDACQNSSVRIAGMLGSRIKLLGKTVERVNSRHFMGRIFATFVCKMFGIPIYDSQCGCKFFLTREVRPLLPLIQSKGWLWDTQLVILLHLAGKNLIEVPVSWSEVAGTKISFIRDPIRMFFGLFKFRKHLREIDYPTLMPSATAAVPLATQTRKSSRKLSSGN